MLEKSLYDTNPEVQSSFRNLVKTATRTEKSQIVDVITPAFSTDPAVRWMYPNSQQFLQSFPNFVRMFGGKAFETESAYYIEGFSAASLWLPPNVAPNEDALVSLFKNSVDCRIQDELFYVFEQMGNFHPKEPHWYLPLIGADPAQQGKGYGSILMQHALMRCDRRSMKAIIAFVLFCNLPVKKPNIFSFSKSSAKNFRIISVRRARSSVRLRKLPKPSCRISRRRLP